jgi:shikimate dehydrogenase
VTLRVGLLGRPLRRRHSKVMHDAAFHAVGIDAEYELLELEPDEVPPTVAAARGPGWLGLGVTAPYKRVVAGLVDLVEPEARAIGAVNNVVRTPDGRLVGFNSDAPGFRVAAERLLDGSMAGRDVYVAGAGGAAHAVVFAALDAGARRVTVANRTPERARSLATRLNGRGRGEVRVVEDQRSATEALQRADLAVNATSVGMLDAGITLDVNALRDDAAVFDLVYVPFETELLRAARARGLRAANGGEMLIAQAAIAFERWTGIGGVESVMRAAVAPLFADAAAVA